MIEYEQDNLPMGWTWTTVNQIALTIRYGYTASAEDRLNGPRFLRITDIQEGKVDWHAVPSCKITPQEAAKYRLAPGDIVFARTGATTGKSYLITSCPDAVFASYLIRLQIVRSIVPAYVYTFFQSVAYWRQIEAGKRGIGQPNVNAQVLGQILIPVPPHTEQRRIVEEIEKQFTRLDAGVAALKRVQANLKRYRASVLKAACEGRLVPTEAELARAEGRNYEPADVLLQRILNERRAKWEADQLAKMKAKGKMLMGDKWKAKYKESAEPDRSTLPKLPEGWIWVTVDAMLAEPLCNGISVKGSNTPPGVAALKLNAMSEKGFNYQFIRYLPINRAIVRELRVVAGDFFVSRGNGSLTLVGRGTLAQVPPFEIVFPDTMIRLRFLGIIGSTFWIPTIWPTQFIRRQIEKRVKTTAGIWKIAQPEVASIILPLPPLTEQHRILAEVERRLSVIDEIETIVEANLTRAERLRQSILKRAFEGKLVPQDPNDEPAEKLLERLRAARAKQQAKFNYSAQPP